MIIIINEFELIRYGIGIVLLRCDAFICANPDESRNKMFLCLFVFFYAFHSYPDIFVACIYRFCMLSHRYYGP